MNNACYLLSGSTTGAQLLVDAAGAVTAGGGRAGSGRLDLVATTHQHWDHHQALADVVSATGARTAAGADADELPVPVGERLARAATVSTTRALMDRLVSFANDLGLLSEEYDVGADRQAGNTPQALSHLALVRASNALDHVRRASIRR